MCGIAGIVGRLSDANRLALRKMAKALAHRGPDDERFFESSRSASEGVLLAHRRLSILDLSEAGAQPMTDEVSQRHTLITNGEIYNFLELRNVLLQEGHSFKGRSDTEIMLRWLAMRGTAAIGDLRGMFAFAFWDCIAGELTLARDSLGIKPLYICVNPDTDANREWSVLFASEVRAILASKLLIGPRLAPAALASYVWNGYVAGPETIVDGIQSLPAGLAVTFDLKGRELKRASFWHRPAAAEPKEASREVVRDALMESVRLHLASDVPLGVFLSGGIDSSVVANLAAKSSSSEIVTFTLSFEEAEYDEGPFAKRVAQAIGTRHREAKLTEQRFLSSLDHALDSIDQPTFDGLNSFYISQAVRETGIKVVLAGSGGDELFGGYRTFQDLPRLQAVAEAIRWMPQSGRIAIARLISKLLDRSGGGPIGSQARWAKLPDMMKQPEDILRLYQLAYALFLPGFQTLLLQEHPVKCSISNGLQLALSKDLRQQIADRSVLSTISVLEQSLFLRERLLRDTDVASMAVSLETRLPLVDNKVTEIVERLPDDVRFQPVGRKQLLRDIGLEGLPKELFERPKRGFQMPFDRWLRKKLGAEMDKLMRDQALCGAIGLNGQTVSQMWQSFQDGLALYWSRLWAIYVLLRWCDRHDIRLK